MERNSWKELLLWQQRSTRKPLLVLGARQVGKTYLMKKFAAANFKNVVYINCDEEPRMASLFENDYDIERIINTLQIISKEKIVAGETCIILDEIQEVPRGLTSLKYFCENAPQYPVMAAGSLMGFALHKGTSFPVGKVEILHLYPMGFDEFLMAMGEQALCDVLRSLDWKMVEIFKSRFTELLRQYYFVGGMPEAVSAYSRHKDATEVRNIQKNILTAYENDISKYAPTGEIARIRMVWNSIPAQLSKENKKFIYGVLKEGGRAKEFETAIEWLKDYGILYKINRIKKPGMPLAMYEDFSAFKLFMLDCGLFGALSFTPPELILTGDQIFEEYKGAFTEEYVLEQLMLLQDTPVYYWSNDSSTGELDFVVQHQGSIIPVEVKAEENLKSKSLRNFVLAHKGLKGLRLSMSNYREQDWMINVPLYAACSYFEK